MVDTSPLTKRYTKLAGTDKKSFNQVRTIGYGPNLRANSSIGRKWCKCNVGIQKPPTKGGFY